MHMHRSLLIGAAALIWNVTGVVTEAGAQATQAGILCQWAIEMNVQATGEHCFNGRDIELQAAIKDSVDQIDAFIIKNEPTTPEKLAAQKEAARKMFAQSDYCSPTATQFYEHFKAVSPEQIRSGTAALLAVPRKPTMEPCL